MTRERNDVCDPMTWRTSDPRLSGEVAATFNNDIYELDDEVMTVQVASTLLRNDEGEWACSATSLTEGDLAPANVADPTITCVGMGGYEGLSAILVLDEMLQLDGLIFSGDFPPLAEPPATE